MILNHKSAYQFLLDQTEQLNSISFSRVMLEEIHRILVGNLKVKTGLRKAAVGISGSLYMPLSSPQLIEEHLESLLDCINSKVCRYEKALIAIIGLSYLQPFEDGNKRTARLFANGILLSGRCAPLSYRTVSSTNYKEATLIFYEQNSIEAFKKIFIEQYVFAANSYNIA